jgi:hypothetical protein
MAVSFPVPHRNSDQEHNSAWLCVSINIHNKWLEIMLQEASHTWADWLAARLTAAPRCGTRRTKQVTLKARGRNPTADRWTLS